jgi:hypothetical protein
LWVFDYRSALIGVKALQAVFLKFSCVDIRCGVLSAYSFNLMRILKAINFVACCAFIKAIAFIQHISFLT